MNKTSKSPELDENNFTCPSCNVLAYQSWSFLTRASPFAFLDQFKSARCQNCEEESIWKDDNMVYPNILTSDLPHVDMPDSVKELYEEARLVANCSPRAAAALLRVALEKLTEELGETKGNLNTRIKNLKSKGLPEKAIQSLDIVRIFANEGGSHSGEIDLSGADNSQIVDSLFWLVNFIVEKTISENNQIDLIYSKIPKHKIEGINNRDR